MATKGLDDKVSFVWSVADQLRGDFKAHEYGQVILPFLVLRRLECALVPAKDAVIKADESLTIDNVEPILQMKSGFTFYNTSPLDLTKLLNDPNNIAANPLGCYSSGSKSDLPRVVVILLHARANWNRRSLSPWMAQHTRNRK